MYQNLFVAKLPRNLVDADLMRIFADYEPTSSKVMLDAVTGKSKGFGFVLFDSEEKGSNAYKALNRRGTRACGHNFTLVIYPSNHDGRVANEASNALYIRNIPITVSQQTVEQFLRGFGDLTYCAMREDHHGSPVWVVYAEYATVADAKKALLKLHGNSTYFPGTSPILAKYEDSDDAKKQRRQRREVLNTMNQNNDHAGSSRNLPSGYDSCNVSSQENMSFSNPGPATSVRSGSFVFTNGANPFGCAKNEAFDMTAYGKQYPHWRPFSGSSGIEGNNYILHANTTDTISTQDNFLPQSSVLPNEMTEFNPRQANGQLPLTVMSVPVTSLQAVNVITSYDTASSPVSASFAHGSNRYGSKVADDMISDVPTTSQPPPPYAMNALPNLVHTIPQMAVTPYHHGIPHPNDIATPFGSPHHHRHHHHHMDNGSSGMIISHPIPIAPPHVYGPHHVQNTLLSTGSLGSGFAGGVDTHTPSWHSVPAGNEFASLRGNTTVTAYSAPTLHNVSNDYDDLCMFNFISDDHGTASTQHDSDTLAVSQLVSPSAWQAAQRTVFAKVSEKGLVDAAPNGEVANSETNIGKSHLNAMIDDLRLDITTEDDDDKSSIILVDKIRTGKDVEGFPQQELIPMLAKLRLVVSSTTVNEKDASDFNSIPTKDTLLKNSSLANTPTSLRSKSSVSGYSAVPTSTGPFTNSNPIAKVLLVPSDRTLSLVS